MMTTEWKDLPTLQDIAEAQAQGWEIQTYQCGWEPWPETGWGKSSSYRGRPRQPKTKTITLRKALMWLEGNGYYVSEVEVNDTIQNRPYFVRWMGMPYTTEVPDDN